MTEGGEEAVILVTNHKRISGGVRRISVDFDGLRSKLMVFNYIEDLNSLNL